MTLRRLAAPLALAAGVALAACASTTDAAATAPAPAARADYPTADRVIYVQDCMKQFPGHHFEMISKCSCVIDKLAAEVPYDDFTEMSTATNANSIGGERGNVIRDTEVMQKDIRRFRELQAAARKSCFITAAPAAR